MDIILYFCMEIDLKKIKSRTPKSVYLKCPHNSLLLHALALSVHAFCVHAQQLLILQKKNWQKNSAPTLKNIYILKGCVVCTLLHILLLHIPWLFLNKKRYFLGKFLITKIHTFWTKNPPKKTFFSLNFFFVCQWKPFFSQLVTTYNKNYYIIRICCPPVSTLFEVVFWGPPKILTL